MGNSSHKYERLEAAVEPEAAAPEPCVGPKLVLVMTPKCRGRVKDVLAAAEKAGLVASQVAFEESSPLRYHKVVTVGATASVLQQLAEERGLEKRLDASSAASGPAADAHSSAKACGMELWRPFARARVGHFAGAAEATSLFSAAEVLNLLCDTLCTGHSAKGSYSALLAVQAAGELDSVLALPDAADLAELEAIWHPLALWRPLPGPQIAAYFGVSVAQYFILMRAYAWWLLLPTCAGVASFAWNEFRERTEVVAGGAFVHSLLSPAFVLLVVVWSTVSVSNWRRVACVSRHNLGQRTMDDAAPTFDSAWHYFKSRGLVVREDGVEVQAQPKVFSTSSLRPLRHVAAVFAMLALLAVSSAVVGALLWLGEWVEVRTSNVILQNTPVLLYVVVVGFLEKFYDNLAERLTILEGHLIHSQHVRSLTIKTAFFQLINNLGWFLYLAFWKRDFNYLRSQLLIFFTVKQVIGNILEIGVPWAQEAWHKRAAAKKPRRRLNSAEEALQRAIEQEWQRPPEEIASDYLEVAVLFAAATWFAPVFPLGMLLAFLHATTEAWGDSYKVCTVTRRMVRQSANEVVLEAWLDIFMIIGCVGIGISVALFRIMDLGWDRLQVEMGEKVILFTWLYLQLNIPHEPEWLTLHLQQVERHLPLHDWLSSAGAAAQKKQA